MVLQEPRLGSLFMRLFPEIVIFASVAEKKENCRKVDCVTALKLFSINSQCASKELSFFDLLDHSPLALVALGVGCLCQAFAFSMIFLRLKN